MITNIPLRCEYGVQNFIGCQYFYEPIEYHECHVRTDSEVTLCSVILSQ